MAEGFAATIKNFADRTERELRQIAIAAAEDVISEANADPLPYTVRSSALLNSVAWSLSGTPALAKTEAEGLAMAAASEGEKAAFELGETISVAWVMNYAARIEYGFSGTDSLGRTYEQAPRAFVRRAVQRWPQIVDAAASRIIRK